MAQQNGGHDLSNNMAAATQQLLSKLEEDLPTIVPEELVMHHFKQAGCNCDEDAKLVKLVVVAGQRFLTAVVNDAMQLARRKAAAQPSRGRAKDQDRRMVLTPEDAAQALREYGVNVRPAPYFVSPADRR